MAEFTWLPDHGSSKGNKLRMLDAKLGDGYSQSVPDGLNALEQTFPLRFKREVSEIDQIEAFLETKLGRSFTFAVPRSATVIRVKCFEWNRDFVSPGWDELTCKFERSPT